MSISKRKKSLQIYEQNVGMERREELLKLLTKSQTRLPEGILHDDLDRGFLDYIKSNYVVMSDGKQIPIIERIMTIQRWGEYTQNWSFSDSDGNLEIPFIAIIRNPEVNYGTHPSTHFNVPVSQKQLWYYATVATFNNGILGADIYKIQQPTPVDLKYEVVIVCTKFRDLNKINQEILINLNNMQNYQLVNGHYIPIFFDGVTDSSPVNTIEGRRFYVQTYKFTMMGYLLDSSKFTVSPAINRALVFTEVMNQKSPKTVSQVGGLEITTVTFKPDGVDKVFNVKENIGVLLNVRINGLIQQQNVEYSFIGGTPRVTFFIAPKNYETVTVTYIKNKTTTLMDPYGNVLQINTETFTYTGGTPTYTLLNEVKAVITLDVNGLEEKQHSGYDMIATDTFSLLYNPVVNSNITITYIF
jgi:hypothetical protein